MKDFAPRLRAADERSRLPKPGTDCARKNFKSFLRATEFFVSCIFATGILYFSAAAAAPAQTPPRNETERELFELLNHERSTQGLPELHWDAALFKAARQHALLMLNLNILEHQLPGEPNLEERLTNVGARFTFVAENIAFGKDSATIHSGWMKSSGHRKNILEPRATAVGIAAVRGSSGIFAVEDFAESFHTMSLDQQENQVASLLRAKGLHVTGANEDARKACDANSGIPGTRAWSVVRFDAPDLQALAPELEKRIRKEPYQNVAVGACHTSAAAGFVRYRIALVFY